ncbi:MAG: hypothetical protein J7M34_02570 [Anaerolineae bacterium]|nr:hypothetical protein [Anaerolineae bacterium]
MVRVTCTRCGRTYTLTSEQIVLAVEESRGTKRRHYVATCPYCHHATKVPLRPIRQEYARMERLGTLPEVAIAEEAPPPNSEGSAGDEGTQKRE